MTTDGQARKLRRLLSRGDRLASAARKTGMNEKTARKYRDSEGLPSQGRPPRTWRTSKPGGMTHSSRKTPAFSIV